MAKKDEPKPDFDKDEYNAVVQGAHLIDVALISSDFAIKPDFFADEGNRKLSTAYERLNCEFQNSILILLVRFNATAKQGNKKLLKCRADYNVVFEVLGGDVNPEAAKAFGSHMAQFTAYPYFRQHVAALSWESGADLPVLPIIRKMPTKRIANKEG